MKSFSTPQESDCRIQDFVTCLLLSSTALCQLVQLIVSPSNRKAKMLKDNRVGKNIALAIKSASQ